MGVNVLGGQMNEKQDHGYNMNGNKSYFETGRILYGGESVFAKHTKITNLVDTIFIFVVFVVLLQTV